jgi:multiple sugar transport system permease protein
MSAVQISARRSRRIALLVRHVVGRVLIYAMVTSGAFVFALPFLWMLSASVKPAKYISLVPMIWIPPEYEWFNYLKPWQVMPFGLFYRNTLLITFSNTIVICLTTSLVAFGFARIPFRGRNWVFLILLSTMMLPGQVTLIPTYLLWSRLNAVNTFWPLMIPEWLSAAYDIFLVRQFYMTISPELDDSARIDGCGWFGIYSRILLPLTKPALGVLAINNFSYNWNYFFGPLIYLNDQRKFTIALGLRLFETRVGGGTTIQNVGPLMAMTIVSMIPVLITFFVAQRYFIQGIVITGVKG